MPETRPAGIGRKTGQAAPAHLQTFPRGLYVTHEASILVLEAPTAALRRASHRAADSLGFDVAALAFSRARVDGFYGAHCWDGHLDRRWHTRRCPSGPR